MGLTCIQAALIEDHPIVPESLDQQLMDTALLRDGKRKRLGEWSAEIRLPAIGRDISTVNIVPDLLWDQMTDGLFGTGSRLDEDDLTYSRGCGGSSGELDGRRRCPLEEWSTIILLIGGSDSRRGSGRGSPSGSGAGGGSGCRRGCDLQEGYTSILRVRSEGRRVKR